MPKPYIVRTYLVALKPDPDTTYDPTQVTLSFTAEEAARMPSASPLATSAAFRKAVEIEHDTHHTPPDREFAHGRIQLVAERQPDRDELLLVPS